MFTLIVMFFLICSDIMVLAQVEDSAWSPPLQIGRYNTGGSGPTQVIVADQGGWLHVFWINNLTEAGSSVIMYTCWNGVEWSTPIDVLLTPEPGNQTRSPQAAVTLDGRLHVVWGAPSGTLYYSWAPARQATTAQAWTNPRVLGGASGSGHSLVADEQGRLHLVFVDSATQSPYYLQSKDGGTSWREPVLIASFNPVEPKAEPNVSSIVIDGRGRIHVAWRRGDAATDYYARSEDDGKSWTSAMELGQPPDATINYHNSPTLAAVGDDTVHLVWLAVYQTRADGSKQAHTRHHQWSEDGGVSWTPMAQILSDISGHNGPNSLVVDTAGVLHQLTVGGAGAGAVHWVEYTWWQGNDWAPYTVIPGSRREDWIADGPSWSQMVLSEGNRLNVVWETRDGSLWYSVRQVDAPRLESQPVPIPTHVTITPTAQEKWSGSRETAAVFATPSVVSISQDSDHSDPVSPIIVGLLSTAVALFVVVAIARRHTFRY